MKNKNQPQVQYTVIYLQLTSTFTVRFGAVPIPLYARRVLVRERLRKYTAK